MASSPISTGPAATSLVSASCQWILRRSSRPMRAAPGRNSRKSHKSGLRLRPWGRKSKSSTSAATARSRPPLQHSSNMELARCVGVGVFLTSQRERIVALAARHRIPSIAPYRDFPAVGGLMSYGTNIPNLYRQAAIYASRILKGEKPGDLPVMLPTKFELVINVKTAKTLGIEIPDRMLALAEKVLD